MPRLKLDLFSSATEPDNPPMEQPVSLDGPKDEAVHVAHTDPTPAQRKPHASPSPKFVPVGFHPKHLHLLDEAVLRLRRQGHWQASKSGLIRCLIEHHEQDMDSLWIENKRG